MPWVEEEEDEEEDEEGACWKVDGYGVWRGEGIAGSGSEGGKETWGRRGVDTLDSGKATSAGARGVEVSS